MTRDRKREEKSGEEEILELFNLYFPKSDEGGTLKKILNIGKPNEISTLIALMELREINDYINEVMKRLEPYKGSEIKLEGYRLLRGGVLRVYADGKTVAELGFNDDDWHLGREMETRLEERLKKEGYNLLEGE